VDGCPNPQPSCLLIGIARALVHVTRVTKLPFGIGATAGLS
jgi:hypothetical protein